MDKEKEINALLLKVAKGCKVAEVTEEYAEVDGQLKLLKRKKTKKDVPPDLKAVQILLGECGGGVEGMTDEELEKEKARLLDLLKTDGQVLDETQKKPRPKPRKKVVRKKKGE